MAEVPAMPLLENNVSYTVNNKSVDALVTAGVQGTSIQQPW